VAQVGVPTQHSIIPSFQSLIAPARMPPETWPRIVKVIHHLLLERQEPGQSATKSNVDFPSLLKYRDANIQWRSMLNDY